MTNPEMLSIDQFHARARAGDAPQGARLRLGFSSTVRAVPDQERVLEFTISTAKVDRYGDSIAVDGWYLDKYRENPVVLWAHDNTLLPVARAIEIGAKDGALKAKAEFTPPGMARFNDTVFDMYKAGFLSATSVGFDPLEWKWVEDGDRIGIDFIRQELLEFSCVPVPANPDCLVEARAKGIDASPLVEWAERLLDGEGRIPIARADLEALRRAAGASRTLYAIEQRMNADKAAHARRLREVEIERARFVNSSDCPGAKAKGITAGPHGPASPRLR